MIYDNNKRITRLLLGIFLAVVVVYSLFQMRDLLFGARLQIASPMDGQVVTTAFFTVEGTMKHARSVSINGNDIKTNQEGFFSEQLVLAPGYNVITVRAEDRFGKSIEKTYRVLYNELQAATSN